MVEKNWGTFVWMLLTLSPRYLPARLRMIHTWENGDFLYLRYTDGGERSANMEARCGKGRYGVEFPCRSY